jgi:uncharacterized protein YjiS (DUF1127 family)
MPFSPRAWAEIGQSALLQLWMSLEATLLRRHQRRQLLALDNRMLKDIGISRCDAWQEASRWD